MMPVEVVLGLLILAGGAGVCGGMIYGVRRERREQRARHKHDWDVRGVEHWGNYVKESEKPVSTTTKVLWACRSCSTRVVKQLEGQWTVEQLGRVRQRKQGFMSPWEGYGTK